MIDRERMVTLAENSQEHMQDTLEDYLEYVGDLRKAYAKVKGKDRDADSAMEKISRWLKASEGLAKKAKRGQALDPVKYSDTMNMMNRYFRSFDKLMHTSVDQSVPGMERLHQIIFLLRNLTDRA